MLEQRIPEGFWVLYPGRRDDEDLFDLVRKKREVCTCTWD